MKIGQINKNNYLNANNLPLSTINDSIISSLSPATKIVFSTTMINKKKIGYIKKKTKLHPRTIRKAIRQLLDLKLIDRIPDLNDNRSCFYVRSYK